MWASDGLGSLRKGREDFLKPTFMPGSGGAMPLILVLGGVEAGSGGARL